MTNSQLEKIVKQLADLKSFKPTLSLEGHSILMRYQVELDQFLKLHPLQFTNNLEKVDFDKGIVSGTVADIAKIIQDKILLADDDLNQHIKSYTNNYPEDTAFCNTIYSISKTAIEKNMPKEYFD